MPPAQLLATCTLAALAASCGRLNFDAVPGEDAAPNAPDIDAAVGPGVDAAMEAKVDAAVASACDTAIACAGFEGDVGAGWDEVIMLGSGTIETSTAFVHKGSQALEVQVFDGSDEGALRLQFPESFASGELWVRTWVYVPMAYTSLSSAGLIYLSEALLPEQYIDITVTSSGVSVFRERSNEGEDIFVSSDVVMADQWRCVEFNVVLGIAGYLRLYVDSALVVDSGEQNMTVQGGGFPSLFLGQSRPIVEIPGSPIYIDDVIVGTSRAGCNVLLP